MWRGLLGLLLVATSSVVEAAEDEEDSGISAIPEVRWEMIRTELGKAAVGAVVSLTPKINNLDVFTEYYTIGFHLVPNVEIKTGGNDSFESAVAKATGFFMRHTGKEKGGLNLYNHYVHLMPYSFGVETDENFEAVAAIVEIGYTPIFAKPAKGRDRFGLDNGLVGLFVQWGRKWQGTSSTVAATGGAADESEEPTNENVARLKMELAYDFDFTLFGKPISIKPDAEGWYDLRNDEWYYHAEAEFRFEWREKKYLHTTYEKGSGAPNFNEGDQISAGLTVAF